MCMVLTSVYVFGLVFLMNVLLDYHVSVKIIYKMLTLNNLAYL